MPNPALSSRVPAALLIIAAAGGGMLAWSWGTWPDAMIDVGRELYVPWRLAQGDVLYRDVVYEYGPLSPHLNAALFRWFGVSVRTLVLANLVLFGVLLAVLYSILRAAAVHPDGR